MKIFISFFIFEFKRFFSSKRNLVIFGLALVVSGYLVLTGIHQYKDMKKRKNEFREVERKKVEQIVNYDQYGAYGFRLYFMPSPLSSFFFNSSHFTELTCRIDSGEKLNIYGLYKGKKIFEEKPGRLFDLSGIIFILGSFLALYFGLDCFRKRAYIKFLSSLYGHRQTFIYIWLSRLILLWTFFIAILLFATLILALNQIEIDKNVSSHFMQFLLVMLVMQTFFFTVGTFAGSLKKGMRGLAVVLIWILFVYLIPAGVNKIVEGKSEKMPSYYEVELEKLKPLMAFEDEVKEKIEKLMKRYTLVRTLLNEMTDQSDVSTNNFEKLIKEQIKKEGITEEELSVLKTIESWLADNLSKAKTIDGIKKYLEEMKADLAKRGNKIPEEMARRYLDKEYIEIQKIENKLKTKMESHITFSETLSSFFPTTFYLSTSDEISSRGYSNIIEFYQFALDSKTEFMVFYVNEKYEPEANKNKIKSFIEDVKETEQNFKEANVFPALSKLPKNFYFGILMSMVWIILFFVASYRRYRKALYSCPDEEIKGLKDLEIELGKKMANVVLCRRKITMSDHLYNVLSGKNKKSKGFSGKVVVDSTDIVEANEKTDFVYLCQPDRIPHDIKAGHFVSFITGTLKFSDEEKQKLSDKLNLKEIGKKEFRELVEMEKGQIVFHTILFKSSKIYMFHDFLRGMPGDFVKEFRDHLNVLRGEGASILYVTNDIFLGRKIGDYVSVLKADAALMTSNL